MTSALAIEADQIAAIREFNRFYTARLGLLRKRHLDGDFSLTEARILYEIGSSPGLTARALCSTLQLDPGYISRTLATLATRKLIRQAPSKQDGRERLLKLSASGQITMAKLNRQSESQIRQLLSSIAPADRGALVQSLVQARAILSPKNEPPIQILRVTEASQAVLQLLQEYYEAVHVVQRDNPQKIQAILQARASGLWVATLAGKAVGCVVLRELPSIRRAAECKRLYVQPQARGRGIAEKLMDSLEDFARSQGVEFIYLDSYGDLKTAIALYRKRGYEECERYNDNPQATIFLRKRISEPVSK